MSDYSEAEFVVVEQVFPSSHLYICDFHREQAWERWTREWLNGTWLGISQVMLIPCMVTVCTC